MSNTRMNNDNQDQAGTWGDRIASRRTFLQRSTVAGAVVPGIALALAGQSPVFAKGPKFTKLPNLFPKQNRNIFFEILQDEENHVTQLSLQSDFVVSTSPAIPTFKNLVQKTPQQFVQTAAFIENGGVGSYLQGLSAISPGGHHDYFGIAAGITAVEAQHTGFLNALLDQSIAPSALANQNNPGIATPIPPQTIINAITGLGVIASLNDFAPWFTPYDTNFDATNANTHAVDDMNDQHIINFSLVLEFLEVAYYRQNIEAFFDFL
jgi:Ferritin-like domain